MLFFSFWLLFLQLLCKRSYSTIMRLTIGCERGVHKNRFETRSADALHICLLATKVAIDEVLLCSANRYCALPTELYRATRNDRICCKQKVCICMYIGKALGSGRKCQSAWSLKEKVVYDHGSGGGGGGGSFLCIVVIYVTVGVMKVHNGRSLLVRSVRGLRWSMRPRTIPLGCVVQQLPWFYCSHTRLG